MENPIKLGAEGASESETLRQKDKAELKTDFSSLFCALTFERFARSFLFLANSQKGIL